MDSLFQVPDVVENFSFDDQVRILDPCRRILCIFIRFIYVPSCFLGHHESLSRSSSLFFASDANRS